ncbi:unnamed protein product [Caenorhabditis brenneri]
MPDRNAVVAQNLAKGDVIWVPYRLDPLWPALVNNVYPKKVSYSFFPLSADDESKKSRFSCAPKLTYAFVTTEALPTNANDDLKEAYLSACKYLSDKGKTRGANIQSFGEAKVEDRVKNENKIERAKQEKSQKRKLEKLESGDETDDSKPPPVKTSSNSNPGHSNTLTSHHRISITERKSDIMMKTIDHRLEKLVEECWSNEDFSDSRKHLMKDELTIKLKNNKFLKEADYESVFDKVFNIVRTKNSSLSLITAFNITSHIMPHVLITCYSICKNLDYEAAKNIYHQQNTRVLGLDPSMNIPVTDHLEELCRLACDESAAIQK